MGTFVRGQSRGRMAIAAVVAVLAIGLVWGLTGALATSGSPSPTGGKVILKVGATNIPDNMNPFIGQMSACYEVWSLNYDLMVGFDSADYSHQKGLDKATGLAYDWSDSSDGLTWTFKIRSGVKWQDGQPLTAEDIAWTYNFIIDNKVGAYTMYTNYITSVTAPDAQTVVFKTSKPKANMLNMWVYIVPEHVWSKIDPKVAVNSYPNNGPVIGSGPFQLISYKKDTVAIMTANKNYWRGAPKVDEVDFLYYQNADTMLEELKAGITQAVWDVPSAQFNSLKSSSTLKPLSAIDQELDELAFNCYTGPSKGNPVLKDWHFRQALQWAVDHDTLQRIAYGGHAQVATSVLVSNFWKNPDWHWEPPADQKYTFDLNKAKAALDAAGYKDTNGDGKREYQGKPIVLRLWTRADSATSQSAGKLITGWFKQLGLTIQLSVLSDGAISDGIYATQNGKFTPNYDMFLWGWGGDPDPNFIMSIFTSEQINSWSDCAWSDPQYDKLFVQQQTTLDPTQRKAIIDQMQQIIYEQSPYIATCYPESTEAYNYTDWQGWVHAPAPDGGVFFTSPCVDSYLMVHPATAAATSGSSQTALWVIVGIVVAVVVVIVIWVLSRRGKKATVEE